VLIGSGRGKGAVDLQLVRSENKKGPTKYGESDKARAFDSQREGERADIGIE